MRQSLSVETSSEFDKELESQLRDQNYSTQRCSASGYGIYLVLPVQIERINTDFVHTRG